MASLPRLSILSHIWCQQSTRNPLSHINRFTVTQHTIPPPAPPLSTFRQLICSQCQCDNFVNILRRLSLTYSISSFLYGTPAGNEVPGSQYDSRTAWGGFPGAGGPRRAARGGRSRAGCLSSVTRGGRCSVGGLGRVARSGPSRQLNMLSKELNDMMKTHWLGETENARSFYK